MRRALAALALLAACSEANSTIPPDPDAATDVDAATAGPCPPAVEPLAFVEAAPGLVPSAKIATIGDFDGDGATDIAYSTLEHGTAILRNDGHGSFRRWSSGYPQGDVLFGADIDSDGVSELLFTSWNLYAMEPAAGFVPYTAKPALILEPTLAFARASLTFQDLTKDGSRELVAYSAGTSEVYVLAYGPTGALGVVWHGDGPFGQLGDGFAIADADGDGVLDIATGNAVYLGNGDGTFDEAQLLDGVYTCDVLMAADLNDDGVDDLLCSDRSPDNPKDTQVLAASFKAGKFTVSPFESPAPGTAPHLAADVDGDGTDEVIAAGEGGLAVLRPTGGQLSLVSLEPVIAEPPDQVLAFEANGDGHLDLAVFSPSQFVLLLGDGTGHFTARRTPEIPWPINSLYAVDLDADGRDDLVATAKGVWNWSIWVLRSQGDGTFDLRSEHEVPLEPGGLAFGDVTGDGVVDIVTAQRFLGDYDPSPCFYDGDVAAHVLPGQGGAAFSPAVALESPKDHEATWTATSDVDGDGLTDIVVAFGKQRIEFSSEDGTATCNGARGHEYLTYLSHGDGTFTTVGPFVPKPAPGGKCTMDETTPLEIALADLTGDDVIDLVVFASYFYAALEPPDVMSSACRFGPTEDCVPTVQAKQGRTSVVVVKGDGAGNFPDVVDAEWGTSGTMGLGDLTGDGWTDLVFGTDHYGDVFVLRGLGTDPTADPLWPTANTCLCAYAPGGPACPPDPLRVLETAETGDVHVPGQSKVATGRFDGDACSDVAVLVRNGELEASRLLLYQGGAELRRDVELAPPGDGSTIATGDFDGDGRVDVAVGAESGLIAIFLNATKR